MTDACYLDVDHDMLVWDTRHIEADLLANRATNRVIGIYSSIGLHRSVCAARMLAELLVEDGYRVTVFNLECARRPWASDYVQVEFGVPLSSTATADATGATPLSSTATANATGATPLSSTATADATGATPLSAACVNCFLCFLLCTAPISLQPTACFILVTVYIKSMVYVKFVVEAQGRRALMSHCLPCVAADEGIGTIADEGNGLHVCV